MNKEQIELLKNKLIKGLNEEYYLAASGATRSNDNKNLILSINEAKYISNLLDLEYKREEIERKAYEAGQIHEHNSYINPMFGKVTYDEWKKSQNQEHGI